VRVIALEEHFVTPELAAYGASTASIAQPGAWRAASRRLAGLTEERLPAMDAAGVDVAVLSRSRSCAPATASNNSPRCAHNRSIGATERNPSHDC
jgi:2,3-dihydroxybenzoate decarboxylase